MTIRRRHLHALHDPACACLNLADSLRANLEQRDVEPCPVHDPDAHQARHAEHARSEAEADRDRLYDVLEIEPSTPVAVDPLLSSLTTAINRGASLPLNASADQFAQAMGLPNAGHHNPTRPFDGPDAA